MADLIAPEPTDPDPPAPGPLATHPVTSLLIGLLVLASIAVGLATPLYARIAPKVGGFPFFYFFLLVLSPAVGLVLWAATLLQRRLGDPAGGQR